MPMRKREEIQKVLRGLAPDNSSSDKVVRPVSIAAIQFATTLNRDVNIRRALQFAQTALEKGSRVICFPECFSLPWFHQMEMATFKKYAEPVPGPSTEPFIKLAAENDVVFICPIFEQDGGDNYFTAVVIGSHGILGKYRKAHLADTVFWEEIKYAQPGDELPVFETDLMKIGILMGWDLFYPEAIKTLVTQGAELIIAPTAAAFASQSRWLNVLIGHAVCNNCFVLRVNRCGKEEDLEFYGESFCVDPFGILLEQPTFHRDALMLAEIDLGEIALAKKEFDFTKARRSELYVCGPTGPTERLTK